MNSELARRSRGQLSKSDATLSREAGKGLMTIGAGGLTIGAAAWLLPFVTLPLLLVLAVFAGLFLYAR